MAWLDRDRMPFRFAVATSVVSTLTAAALIAAVRSGFADSAAIVWVALAVAVVAAMSAGGGLLFRARRTARRSFLVTSAFSQKYFVAAFVQRLHSALDRNGIDLVLKVPDRDYDASAQSHHLRRLLERRRDYIGGIIVATEAQRLRKDLNAFCQKFRSPVVFTDIEPYAKESEYPKNTAFVGYDTGALGELAGRWLVKHLRGNSRPRVLVIASREHPERQQQCTQALLLGLPDVLLTIDDGCEFVRSRACRAVQSHVRDLGPGDRLDAIFCTNDEMALGAVDALSLTSPATRSTVVVGIDGVLEARALIDTASSPLRATVVQDTHQLAVRVVDILEKMHRGNTVAVRHILDPEIYEAPPT